MSHIVPFLTPKLSNTNHNHQTQTTTCFLQAAARFYLVLHYFRSVMAAVHFLLLITLSLPNLCFSQSDADTLMKLKESFIDGDLTNWIPGPDSSPCLQKWDGVLCRGEAIIGLHLTGFNLSGTIDIEPLLQLPDLRSISVMRNNFEGPIPAFNELGALKSVYLSQNQFSGEIPNDYFSSMRSLKKVWLDENKFSGNIPESVMQLPQLLELHLEENQFSGPIPRLIFPNFLTSINLTSNNLEGEIPESLSKFGADSFEGNIGLCGGPLPIDCANNQVQPPAASSPSVQNKIRIHKSESETRGKAMLAATTIFIALCFIIASCISTSHEKTNKDNAFGLKSVASIRGVVLPVYVPPESDDRNSVSSNRRSISESGRDSPSSQPAAEKGLADLITLNAEKGVFGLQDLMKASAEVLGNAVLGSAYKTVMANGLTVVVKRMKDMNRLEKDEFDVEMRRFGKLNHPNVLMPLAYHYRKEEKLIISEYMPKGNLFYVLHDTQDEVHANLNWPTRLKIIKGIVRGLGFIHTEFSTNEVPHGNLKSSNILLSENYDPLLSDYAFQTLTDDNIAAQVLFAYKSPEYLQYQQVSPKSDVYCLGIVILEIMTGKIPSQYLSNAKGGIDIVQWVQISILENKAEELIDPDIANNAAAGSINQMLQVLKIGAACTESNPDKRLDINQVISKIEEVS